MFARNIPHARKYGAKVRRFLRIDFIVCFIVFSFCAKQQKCAEIKGVLQKRHIPRTQRRKEPEATQDKRKKLSLLSMLSF